MRCGICGSKKDVRWFKGRLVYKDGFTECRKCFDKIASSAFARGCSKEEIEEEWDRGIAEHKGGKA